jgi:hypothetical protein
MTFEEINPTPPLKIEKTTCQQIRRALEHSNGPRTKNLSKIPIRVE